MEKEKIAEKDEKFYLRVFELALPEIRKINIKELADEYKAEIAVFRSL